MPLLESTPEGLYCPAGDFHIDPCRRVTRALITHAHSDHARRGGFVYLCAQPGVALLRERVGTSAVISGLRYGESLRLKDVQVSFHPAGHILGSAQIRLEYRGEIWVVTGDYKLAADPTCQPFEPVPCHTLITESTFGLPVFRWPETRQVTEHIHRWWQHNQASGCTSVLLVYPLGKTQRILASLTPEAGPILVHASSARFLPGYAAAGVQLPEVQSATPDAVRAASGRALVLATPAARESTWLSQLGPVSLGYASGWMLMRGMRQRQKVDRGFALSDHADWDGLLACIRASQAERVLVTHGYAASLARWLQENGWTAQTLGAEASNDGMDPSEANEPEGLPTQSPDEPHLDV